MDLLCIVTMALFYEAAPSKMPNNALPVKNNFEMLELAKLQHFQFNEIL